MRCPACGELEDKVIDSRANEDGTSIRRRRQCESCSTRFTTFERVQETAVVVVKRDGRRVPFDRSKIESGLRSACKGRPVGAEEIAALVDSVEATLPSHGGEVEAATIGELALARLRHLDGVAALRFASVYKSFEELEDFEREIQLLGLDGDATPA